MSEEQQQQQQQEVKKAEGTEAPKKVEDKVGGHGSFTYDKEDPSLAPIPLTGETPRERCIATDAEFKRFISLCDEVENWTEAYKSKDEVTKVYTRYTEGNPIMCIKVLSYFADVEPEVMYDVLHDHYFRATWDNNMLEGSIVEMMDPSNEVGYYAAKMPFPLANRDFCNHRSWKIFPECEEWPESQTWVIFNKSVIHKDCPEVNKITRGWSYLGGYMVRKRKEGGCHVYYYAQSDPRGWIPTFLINMVSGKLAPSLLENVHKEALRYPEWKKTNHPDWKPWLTGYDPKEEPYKRHKK